MATISLTISGETPTGVSLLTLVRTDTSATVPGVSLPAAFTSSGGQWVFSFTEPAAGLVYAYTFRVSWSDGTTTDEGGTVAGAAATTAAPDLVTSARAQQNATLAALATTNPSLLASLITAASDAIRSTCMRDFAATAYTEYHDGFGYPNQELMLGQFPVLGVDRVATCPIGVLTVNNTSTANQRATVATTDTGILLARVASGVSLIATLLYANYPTITALATAIAAAGNGWAAVVQPGYELWASADLRPLQGAVSAATPNRAVLELYAEDVGMLPWSGEYYCGSGTGVGWRLDKDTGQLFGSFPRGRMNVRVDYTAGFATVPAQVQEACVQLTAAMYAAGQRDPAATSIALGPYKATYSEGAAAKLVRSPAVYSLIAPYVDHAKRFGRF